MSGCSASVALTAALALAARMEGKAAAQPLNATSHWLHGERAASVRGVDLAHTGIGYATNHLASIFWAVFFQAWRARHPGRPVLRDALALSAIAAAVDYGATPKRFTPGWEFVLSRKGMAFAYAGMALGLALGARLTRGEQRWWAG